MRRCRYAGIGREPCACLHGKGKAPDESGPDVKALLRKLLVQLFVPVIFSDCKKTWHMKSRKKSWRKKATPGTGLSLSFSEEREAKQVADYSNF